MLCCFLNCMYWACICSKSLQTCTGICKIPCLIIQAGTQPPIFMQWSNFNKQCCSLCLEMCNTCCTICPRTKPAVGGTSSCSHQRSTKMCFSAVVVHRRAQQNSRGLITQLMGDLPNMWITSWVLTNIIIILCMYVLGKLLYNFCSLTSFTVAAHMNMFKHGKNVIVGKG